ncbi:GapS6a family protein [Pseudomonas syringae]|uniref:GapS6a family protein n=1 Tax=Pseudomonas syringae TaxID=317 RepID=UPI003F74E98B
MDFITTGIIANSAYDVFKNGLTLTAQSIKERLGKWIKDDVLAEAIAAELAKLEVNDEMSEVAIIRRLDASQAFQGLVRDINAQAALVAPSQVNTVNQNHSGSGDNVAGNKISH